MKVTDQAFIYCAAIYEQQLQDSLLSSLPQDRSERMKKELQKFEKFPRGVRLTMALKLLGHLIQHVENPHLEMIHPSWIADALSRQEPRIVFEILQQFSPEYAARLIDSMALAKEPVSDPLGGLSSDTIQMLMALLVRQFESMSAPWGEPDLTLETLYLLKEEDLIVLMKQLGMHEIARAFVLAGKDVLGAVVMRFPQEIQEDFLMAVKTAQNDSMERQKIAAKRITQIDLASLPIEEGALKMGLIKAGCVFQKASAVARKIAQRLPMNLGEVLLAPAQEDCTEEESREIMEVIADLIARKRIDQKYVETRFAATADSIALRVSSTGTVQ